MALPSTGVLNLSAIADEFRLPVTQNVTNTSPNAVSFGTIRSGYIDTDNPVKIRTTNSILPIPVYTYSVGGLTSFSCSYYIYCDNTYQYAKFGYRMRYRIYQNGVWGAYSVALTIVEGGLNYNPYGPYSGSVTLYNGDKLSNDAQIEIIFNAHSDVSDATSMYWQISGRNSNYYFGGGSVGLTQIVYSRIYYPNGRNGNFNLSDYYRGGAYVWDTATNTGIPTSGQIKLSHFYGTSQR